ncbi:MAG: hypothetical protein WA951_05730 [Leeuwenhoekiella sp.]
MKPIHQVSCGPLFNSLTTDAYCLTLLPNYAHIIYYDPIHLDANTLSEVRMHIANYYNGANYVLINERVNDIAIDPKYHKDSPKNMKAIAIVSENELWRERLYPEQLNSTKPFAYFNAMEEARQWADHIMESRLFKI